MGIIYGDKNGISFVEARTASVIISVAEKSEIEVDYIDLDLLGRLVKKAQQVRRDKK